MNFPIVTKPHGAQKIVKIYPDDKGPLKDSLFYVVNEQNQNRLIMTGEELTSLAMQWIEFANLIP